MTNLDKLITSVRRTRTGLGCMAVTVVGICSCKSSDNSNKESKSQGGALVIHGTNPGAVKGAATIVFQDHGYKLSRMDKETLVFEKPGSNWDNLAYGNWMESKVWDRCKVTLDTVDAT